MAPTFSWSEERDALFRACLRRYYFHYYGAPAGRQPDAPPRARRIAELDRLLPRAEWMEGHVRASLRQVLEALSAAAPPPEAAVTDALLNALRRDYKASRAGVATRDPGAPAGLFEHAYGLPVSDAAWKEEADRAVRAAAAFLRSSWFADYAAGAPADRLPLAMPPLFHLAGLPVEAPLDAALRCGAVIRLGQWNTRPLNDRRRELGRDACFLYAMEQWQAGPEQLQLVRVNLATGEEQIAMPDPARLEETRELIRESADEMLFPTESGDQAVPAEDLFECTDQAAACRTCSFLGVCPRWTVPAG